MLRVALTGGIASGKSTVSELFAQRGIEVIDADLISRDLVQPGQPALAAIVAHFGTRVLDADGRLDRAALRQIVFRQPEQRLALEAILHPLVQQHMRRLAAAARSAYVLLVVPLLAEGDHSYDAHRVLLVDAPEPLQLERLMRRDRSSAEQARQILAAQADRDRRLAIADDIIDNTHRPEALDAQVETLHRAYLALAGQVSASDAERVRQRLAALSAD